MVVAAATSGISEKVQLKLETAYGDGGAGAAVANVLIRKLAWTADSHLSANYSVDGTGIANTLTDGVLSFNGTLDTYISDGRELVYAIGTAGGASPNFTIAVANVLPSFGFYAVNDSGASDNVNGKGFKVSKVTIKGSRGNKVEATYNIVGKNVVESATAVTPGTSTTSPFVDLDTVMTINGGVAVNLEDWQLTIDRATEARRGIESATTNTKRLITAAIEKKLSVTGSGTAVADKLIYEALMGGAALTDTRTPANIVITITNATNSITFTTSGLISVVGRNSGAEDNLMIMKFDFIGKSIAVAGTFTP